MTFKGSFQKCYANSECYEPLSGAEEMKENKIKLASNSAKVNTSKIVLSFSELENNN